MQRSPFFAFILQAAWLIPLQLLLFKSVQVSFHSTVPSTPLLHYPGQHLPFSGSVFLTNSEMASVLICYLRNSWAWWALLENPAQSANTQTIFLHGSHFCLVMA